MNALEEETRFLQRRVALLGLIGFFLGALAFVITVANSLYVRSTAYVVPQAIHLLGLAAPLSAWLLCRGAHRRSHRFVRGVENVATIGSTLCFQAMALQLPALTRPDLVAALITMQIVVSRAVLVPSTAVRTALLSTLASLGLFAVAYRVHLGYRAAGSPFATLSEQIASALTWGVLGVALATVTSSVIYGLRRAVRRAEELGQYTLLEKLGEGGMGQVFRARHAMLRRPTAVKLLHTSSPEDLARFEQEVQLTAQLSHPNTVTVFDYGRTPEGVFYYAMELLDGLDLQKLVARYGPMPTGRVIRVLSQVAAALADAHAIGLIHRDIKPANVILAVRAASWDVAKVVDFGLVRRIDEGARSERSASEPGRIMGTPLYIAPETLRDPNVADLRTDLYSLGALGYFLLTGTPVFEGTSLAAVLEAHLHTPPEPPSMRLGRPIAADLEKILLDCLAKTPEERPRDGTAVRDRLLACRDASSWRDDDARAWWSAASLGAQDVDLAFGSARTINVDLAMRSPRATTLA